MNEACKQPSCIVLIDDPSIRCAFIRATVAAGGWRVITIAPAIPVKPFLEQCQPDLLIIDLTPTEYAVLLQLIQHAGTTLPYDVLLQQVGDSLSVPDQSYLTVYIWHLRQKVEPDPRHPSLLQEVIGIGYRLAP